MFWLFVINFILHSIAYEVLRRNNKTLAKEVHFLGTRWLWSKNSQYYTGWLLVGNFYYDFKHSVKLKAFFELCRITSLFTIVFILIYLWQRLELQL